MKDLCTFYRLAASDAGDYGQASSDPDTVVASDIPCRVAYLQGQSMENTATGQVMSEVRGKLFIPYDATWPSPADYVVITTQNNRRLEVRGIIWVTEQFTAEIDFTTTAIPEQAAAAGGEAILDSNGASILDSDGETILDSAA
jgi:hypothetical protein